MSTRTGLKDMKAGHITLHDVAAKAGVSVATASRALTGTKVNKKNQEKVRKAATELGYVPNEGARSLRNVRTMTVGVVFSQLNSALSTELLDALSSKLDEYGYSLFVATSQGVEERFDNLVHRFLERRVDALFCVNPAGEGRALERYHNAGIPVISLYGQTGGYAKLPLIASSVGDASKAAIARLQQLGHKTIGVLRPARRSRPIEAFSDYARETGMTVRTYDIPEGPLDAVGLINNMMNDSRSPTVVVGRQADAVRMFEAADDMSIIVPRMLSIIAIRDRTQQMPATRLQISMIHLNPGAVGAEAADILVKHFQGKKLFKGELQVNAGSWVEGGTIAAARGAAKPGPSSRNR